MQAPDDLLAPSHHAGIRRPLLGAETMPAWCYPSDAFHRCEVDRLFIKAWNFAGRAERAASSGDYFFGDLDDDDAPLSDRLGDLPSLMAPYCLMKPLAHTLDNRLPDRVP